MGEGYFLNRENREGFFGKELVRGGFLNKKEKKEGAQGKLPFLFLLTETEEGGPTATPGRRPLGHGGGHGGGENR